jgi:ubiquinone/menaquinone biosynthesis C-methylase UbiE
MNLAHRWLCNSSLWRRTVKAKFPWAIGNVNLGTDVLEIGPGFGATTSLLIDAARRLTCVEINTKSAHSLATRLSDQKVHVIQGDATRMPLPDCSFDSVVCFTMLHHIPSTALQDCLLKEVFRVLRPGGTFAGADSLNSLLFRLLHIRDTMVLVDPTIFPGRLAMVGFEDICVEMGDQAFRFVARRPPIEDIARPRLQSSSRK